jgi:hypothetical protein
VFDSLSPDCLLFHPESRRKDNEEEKIPNISWCTQRGCKSLSWEDGICTTTGKKIKEQTYCPTKHLIGKEPKKKPESEKPNCGGKRPAISRCPDNCPDRSIEKEGGYPQGRCKQTAQKLREMQACPNDPPKPDKKTPVRKPTFCENCGNCHNCGNGVILRGCPSFDDIVKGNVNAEDLKISVIKEGCSGWKSNFKVVEKSPKKPAKKPREKKPEKPLESHNPLRKFLNDHYEQIVTGKDLPIVPRVAEEYKRFDHKQMAVKLFVGLSKGGWEQWWTLSPSGKLRKVSKRTGQHCQGESFPDCKFCFEWHYDDKKKED